MARQRTGPWRTDDRPGSDEPAPAWCIAEPDALDDGRLVVSIGVLRDPASECLVTAGAQAGSVALHLPEPLVSGRGAQASVAVAKRAVDAAVAHLRSNGLSLFVAGPAAFAVALGQR